MNQKQLQSKFAYLLDDVSLLPAEEVKETPVNEKMELQDMITEQKKKIITSKDYEKGYSDGYADAKKDISSGLEIIPESKKSKEPKCKKCNGTGRVNKITQHQDLFGEINKVICKTCGGTGIEKKEESKNKEIKEGFETHVLCSECGSGDLELSKLKTKIRCTKCGNVGLTESILGLEEGKSITENKAKLGSGARFKSLTKKLEKKGAENPKGLAAYIGRKKFGKKKFQKLAVGGK